METSFTVLEAFAGARYDSVPGLLLRFHDQQHGGIKDPIKDIVKKLIELDREEGIMEALSIGFIAGIRWRDSNPLAK
jgi:hypothetical protein